MGNTIHAKMLQQGDIFMFNGLESVAIENYSLASEYLWVTNRQYYNQNGIYSPTSATLIRIAADENVILVGKISSEAGGNMDG